MSKRCYSAAMASSKLLKQVDKWKEEMPCSRQESRVVVEKPQPKCFVKITVIKKHVLCG